MADGVQTFIWYELMTTDPKAAERFYTSVVGWTPKPFPGAVEGYTVLHAGETGIGGIMELPEMARANGTPPGWVGYIHAPDIEQSISSLQKAGGTVRRPPAEIPDVGRFAVVADPQGGVFMLLEPKTTGEPASPVAMSPGRVGWHELYTTDWEAAFAFYSTQFGWAKDTAMDMGPMGTYQIFAARGTPMGGMMNKPASIPVPVWQFYFGVDAIDAAIERVGKAGGQIFMGPQEVPGGAWIIQGTDPQGAHFALVAPKR